MDPLTLQCQTSYTDASALFCPDQVWREPSVEREASPLFQSSFQFQCSGEPKIACNGIFPVRDGQVAIMKSGEDALSARIDVIKNAKHSIRMEALIFRGDESGLYLAELLKQKKRENKNMDIRVIVDTASNMNDWQTQWMYYDLVQHGIPVEGIWFKIVNEVSPEDPENVDRRAHEKLLLADAGTPDAVGVIGGLNIGNEYFQLGLKAKGRWRDQDSVVRGDVIGDAAKGFDRNYEYFREIRKTNVDIARAYDNLIATLGKVPVFYKKNKKIVRKIEDDVAKRHVVRNQQFFQAKVRFLQSRPRYGESYIEQAYASLIRSAKDRVEIANAYFIPPKSLRTTLIDAAKSADKVTVVTNSTASNDLPPMTVVGRSYYEELIRAGIDVYEWAGEGTIHAKYAVIDGYDCVIGSFNFDERSKSINSESALAVESEGACGQLSKLFAADVKNSRKIEKNEADDFSKPEAIIKRLEFLMSKPFEGKF